MSRRVVIGKRANGENGIFVSNSGFDAFTTPDNNLILSVSSKIVQLLLLGFSNSNAYVPLGFGRMPVVILTTRLTMLGVAGYGDFDGPSRPAPNDLYSTNPEPSFADVQPDGSYMLVYPAQPNRVSYAVYNVPF